MSTFNELIDFTRSTTGTYLDSVVLTESVTNGDFDAGTNGWAEYDYKASVSATGGQLTVIATGIGNGSFAYQKINAEVGKTYIVTAQISTTGIAYVRADTDISTPWSVLGGTSFVGTANVTKSFTFIATEEEIYIGLGTSNASVGLSATYNYISVKEVIGGQVSGTPLLRTAAINEPRLEYDASGNPLGLLIEEARTNLLAYSEGFTSGWSDIFCFTTANAIASPDGAVSGAKLQEDSSGVNGPRFFPNNNAVLTANQAQTLSCFFKAGTSAYAYLTIRHSQGNVAAVEFDLTSGTVNSTTVFGNMTLNGSDITSVGNGWYKCSVTATSSASTTSGFYLLAMTDGSGVTSAGYPNYALTGKNIYAWGAQLEEGAFPTSYIPTSGSTVTRAVDSAVATLSDFYYRQKHGSMVVEFTSKYDESAALYKRVYEIGNTGTSVNRILLFAKTDVTRLTSQVRDNDSPQYSETLTSSLPNGTGVYSKAAMAWEINNAHAAFDGNVVGSVDTDVSLTQTRDTLGIMRSTTGTTATLTGHIKSIQYYPLRVADAKLETLTS